MKLLIGIDGGQTSTKCVIATPALQILGEGVGSGLVHLAAEQGDARFLAGLGEAVQAAWQAAQLPPQRVHALVLGLTGIDAHGSLEAQRAEHLAQQVVSCEAIRVHNDAYTALIGAHNNQPGIIVISGTGSIALGKDATGRTARAGGWGWLIGDEGSAMALGRDALIAATQAYDGTGPQTLLLPALMQQLNIADFKECKRIVYAPTFGSRGFAALAPVVSACAQCGDALAQGIVDRAGVALAQLAYGVAQALGLQQSPVAPVSGAFEHIDGLRAAFIRALAVSNEANPVELTVVAPSHSAALGAILIARDL